MILSDLKMQSYHWTYLARGLAEVHNCVSLTHAIYRPIGMEQSTSLFMFENIS